MSEYTIRGESSMELETKGLKPGMVLLHDVNGPSGKPIVPKDTVLTELEIEIIQAFLIEKVTISKSSESAKNTAVHDGRTKLTLQEEVLEAADPFLSVYSEVVAQYKTLFSSWQANIPVKMFQIRELCLPLFELVETKSLSEIKSLLAGRAEDLFFYKTVATSLLSIKLAQLLHYEKKDWLQIGFAAILADIGLAKSKTAINSHEADPRHPALSYEMIKSEATLTQYAKVAIVQHHERLDGTGFPLKITAERIHPYSRIIAVSDRYFTLYVEKEVEVDQHLLAEVSKFAENIVNILVKN